MKRRSAWSLPRSEDSYALVFDMFRFVVVSKVSFAHRSRFWTGSLSIGLGAFRHLSTEALSWPKAFDFMEQDEDGIWTVRVMELG